MLIILKGIREQIGKTFGDEVTISVEPDTEPRLIEIPPDLARELKEDEENQEAFSIKLSYTHQKEYVTWINEAKKQKKHRRTGSWGTNEYDKKKGSTANQTLDRTKETNE